MCPFLNFNPKIIGFDWASVPKNGLVVDVGGSRGHVSLEIAKAFPELNFAVEDRPVVIEEAKKVTSSYP